MRLHATAAMHVCCVSFMHIDLLTGDILQAFFRLLGVVHDDLEVGLQIASKTGLVEDGEV